VLTLPQSNFRGKQLTFDEFSDLTMIGMAGMTGHLMHGTASAFSDGMVNYKRVADSLGLIYEPDWIDRFSRELENGIEAIASHDGAPKGQDDDDSWVYLNSGFTRIASLLYEKYYIPPAHNELNFEEFRDVLLFEFTGMVQDGITEDGKVDNSGKPLSYDLHVVADHFNLSYSTGWIEQVTSEWLTQGYIAKESSPSGGNPPRFRLTRVGYEH
jgi:hypothetical protein